MSVFSFVILILLVRWILAAARGDEPRPAAPRTRWVLLRFPFYCLALSLVLLSSGSPYAHLALIPFPVIAFPSWMARPAIRLGLVRTSYWLGFMAGAVHHRDRLGGALFYGWRALLRSRPERREKALPWLEHRLTGWRRQLRAGAMVMQVLLKYPRLDDTRLMAMLRVLDGCDMRQLPGDIRRYVCRFMLARAIPSGDWALIAATARQWQEHGWNPVAAWLLELHRSHGEDYPRTRRYLHLPLRYLSAGCPGWRRYLPRVLAAAAVPGLDGRGPEQVDRAALLRAEWFFHQRPELNALVLNPYWAHQLDDPQALRFWEARISALGAYDPNEVIEQIRATVQRLTSERDGAAALESDQVEAQRNRDFRLLRVKLQAVNQRVDNERLMHGGQELEEWLSIALLARALSAEPGGRAQVFFAMRQTCWNWVAELWNGGTHRPLAYLISSYMGAGAVALGDTEANETFSLVLTIGAH